MEQAHRPATVEQYYQRVNKALSHLHRHWQQPVSLDELAQIACFSPFHFHRVFQELMGMRVQTYIKQARLTSAAHQLRFSDKSVAEIAQEIGYQTQSAFGEAFRKHYQRTPVAYRRHHRSAAATLPDLPACMLHPPELQILPARQLLYTHRCGDYREIIDVAWQVLTDALEQHALFPCVSQFISIAYDVEEEAPGRCRYDACVEVASPPAEIGELMSKPLAGGLHAVFRFDGPHNLIADAWQHVIAWLGQQPYQLPPRPAYFIHLDKEHGSLLCQPLERVQRAIFGKT